MNSSTLKPTEYNSYYHPYIAALGKVELLASLESGLDSFIGFIEQIPDEKLYYSYSSDKWSIAEVIMHIVDAERIFHYRALRFARNDKTELPGFDQDIYVPASRANSKSKKEIAEEFITVRKSSIALFKSLNEEELKHIGAASGSDMSVRALGFVICGHLLHHRTILMDRYL
ncbi:DinB family protein [Croceitalea sp. MTPC9]|uniref:DinB family protein n=1 Tax=unclassified Croceitalea TaxID=2632280 RepID=UPI002B364032|nr:DinB family protein [Croceitalea sp. MTPC6]GMN15806.1 DinB family protein [Croceitalea sp. MTPC9]